LAKTGFPSFSLGGARETKLNSMLAKMSGPGGFMVSEVRMGFPHRSGHSVGQVTAPT